ncbi:uncharacterized protein LOC129597282 [Paramacrobiotus metropolitanus]|uniref:uncharacterized protein LOC129597282 n=1 Tax=Paramacrobiotus metropolitanus TaxID=2943436 RepID=UPI002445A783|nr:uncharacterized protein LOC129597282 [Paramacrobiotus metropolitanus]
MYGLAGVRLRRASHSAASHAAAYTRRHSRVQRPTGKMETEVLLLLLLGNCEMIIGVVMFALNVIALTIIPYSKFLPFHSSGFLVSGLEFICGLTAMISITRHSTPEDTKKVLPWHLQGSVTALVFFAFLTSALFFSSTLALPDVMVNLMAKDPRSEVDDAPFLRNIYLVLYILFYISFALIAVSMSVAWYLLHNVADLYRLPRSGSENVRVHKPGRSFGGMYRSTGGSVGGGDRVKSRGTLFMNLH